MGTRPLTWHWHASAAAGWLLTGAYRPLCSIVWDIPECAPTQAFKARMDRLFGETQHCLRIHVEWIERRLGIFTG